MKEPFYRFGWPMRKMRLKRGDRRLHGVRASMMDYDSTRHEIYAARRPKKRRA